MTSWTFGPGGVYTASWTPGPPSPVLTVTVTASGALQATFDGDVPSQALAQAAVNALGIGTATPVSGQYLCTPVQYAPGTATNLSTTSATLAAVSSANVNTGSFTAPASGSVTVSASLVYNGASSDVCAFALAAHGTVTPVVGNVVSSDSNSVTNGFPALLQFLVTGLTPGTSYNFDLLFAVAGGGTLNVRAFGQASTTPTGASNVPNAPVVMTVQAV